MISLRVWSIALAVCLGVLGGSPRADAQVFRLPPGEMEAPIFVPDDTGPVTAPQGPALAGPLGEPVFNLDDELPPSDAFGDSEAWSWQTLPRGLIYRSYLASLKDSRMYGGIDSATGDSTLWQNTLGARVGIFRYGTTNYTLPDGIQLDAEGAAQVRLDLENEVDVRSVDFRGGVPLTYGVGAHRFKFGYYHISSHLGDEFVYKNPFFDRLNFSRDVLILGYSYYITPNLRIYGEAGWGFYTIVSEPWEFQAGLDWAPAYRTGARGAPFFAINGHIREELGYSGGLNVQTGWAWRADDGPQLLRVGFQYFNGYSAQWSFPFDHEELFGFGVWYDF